MRALDVELLLEPSDYSIMVSMTEVPREGDQVNLMVAARDGLYCVGKVTRVRWLIMIDERNEDQADNPVVTIELDHEDDMQYKEFMEYIIIKDKEASRRLKARLSA